MTIDVKNLDAPDQKRSFDHGELQVVELAGATVSRAVFRPGWRWSLDIKPSAGTRSCQASHSAYVVSGRLHVRMDDGEEADLGPGDAHTVSTGHDAWVVGDEPCVVIEIATTGAAGDPRFARCPCGVTFSAEPGALDHLVSAVQQHASGSHGHDVTREHVLDELAVG